MDAILKMTLFRRSKIGRLSVGETGVSWDTFHFFSNIAENIYDRDFDLTLQGRGILPLQTGLISYVVTSFVATEYGVNDTWSNCPNLPRPNLTVRRDSVKGVRFTGSLPVKSQMSRNCVCTCACVRACACGRVDWRT